jgi:hypothetical protein
MEIIILLLFILVLFAAFRSPLAPIPRAERSKYGPQAKELKVAAIGIMLFVAALIITAAAGG